MATEKQYALEDIPATPVSSERIDETFRSESIGKIILIAAPPLLLNSVCAPHEFKMKGGFIEPAQRTILTHIARG
jgi:hypothetical protein